MKDIMDTAKPTSEKEIVVFEVNDKGREHEFSRRVRYHNGWDNEYVKLFKSFLQSLGYEFEDDGFAEHVYIGGIKYPIETRNASYMSYNAWTRDASVRKPENRFIKFAGMRIYFNVEFDAGRLRKKVADAAQEEADRQERIRKRNQLQIDNCNAVGQNYYKNPVLRHNVEQLNIHRGDITLYLKHNIGTIHLNNDGSFKQAQYRPMEINNINELNLYTNNVPAHTEIIRKCVIELVNYIQKLPAPLAQWVNETYHIYFDFKTGLPKN